MLATPGWLATRDFRDFRDFRERLERLERLATQVTPAIRQHQVIPKASAVRTLPTMSGPIRYAEIRRSG